MIVEEKRREEDPITLQNFTQQILNDFLFLGDYLSSCQKKILDFYNITHIINASNYYPSSFKPEKSYFELHIEDVHDANISQYFEGAIEFIENTRKKKEVK